MIKKVSSFILLALLLILSACTANRADGTAAVSGGLVSESYTRPVSPATQAAEITAVQATETAGASVTQAVETKAPEPLRELIGMYVLSDDKRQLAGSEYTAERKPGRDIVCLEVFPTLSEEIGAGNYARLWNKYASEELDGCSIYYLIEFDADNKHFSAEIREPQDTRVFWDYIELYIYDDIHQDAGARYSHLTQMEKDTLVSSIKLTGAKNIASVGKITVTAILCKDNSPLSQYTTVLY